MKYIPKLGLDGPLGSYADIFHKAELFDSFVLMPNETIQSCVSNFTETRVALYAHGH